jgi:5-methylcytosine-specific restriction enzyme subunit McrC
VQIGTLVVTVMPKVGTRELLTLVRYAFGLSNVDIYDETDFATTGRLFQDLLVAQLIREATTLTGRGLARRYVARNELLASPRGQIQIGALAGRVPLVDARLPCRHHIRSADHLLNRVLLAGLRLAAELVHDAGLRRSALRLAARLESEIAPLRLDEHVFDRARRAVDRLTSAYAPSLRLIELLYRAKSVALDDETTVELRGFLFDMNRFFQALIGRFLTDHLAGFAVKQEHALRGMMRYAPGANPRKKRAPTPRPDFCVRGGAGVVALLDAKYRDLWQTELPRDMLYQLSMYALSQPRGATATMLYPTVASSAREARIEIRDPVSESALGFVAMRPVVLGELLAAIESETGLGDLARRYAFGEPQLN